MNKYLLKLDYYQEGGCAEFFDIVNHKNIGFKQFKSKKHCCDAFKTQKLLNRYNLAPKTYGSIKKNEILGSWGFITEKATILDFDQMLNRLPEIQKLVDDIYYYTKKKFWDSHTYNIGYIIRKKTFNLVCIDTGNESFCENYNAWGFSSPGPKCNYCDQYNCCCGV
jgi:hypothetical protein